jgi:hypothetical protein
MNIHRSHRSHDTHRQTPRRLVALGAAAVFSASLLVGCQTGQTSAPTPTDPTSTTVTTTDPMPMPPGTRNASENALYQGMQTLWMQHMEWTYAAVAAFAVDSPGFPATADRLLQNQVDIGNAVRPFYGDAAADQLTTLLQEHITGAVAVLTAAKAGDSNALNQAVTAEYANAKAIGDFLGDANPTNWPKADMEAMMATHIDQTLVYATDMLQGDYAQAIANYGLAEAHMVEMADMLSAGVIAQFPDQFKA